MPRGNPMKPFRRPFSLLLPVLVGAAFAATPAVAQSKKKNKKKPADDEVVIDPVEEFEEAGFRKVNLDINGDQKADVYNYYRTGEGDESRLLVRKEINLNFEGERNAARMRVRVSGGVGQCPLRQRRLHGSDGRRKHKRGEDPRLRGHRLTRQLRRGPGPVERRR